MLDILTLWFFNNERIHTVIIMKNPTVIGFYGKSDTGKTTLIEEIIKKLTNDGYNVATMKITDKKTGVDIEGKDTWRHSKAGSKLVVLSSPSETDFILKENMKTKEILEEIAMLGYYDIVLIEGVNDIKIPKIRLGIDIKERENTIETYDKDFNGLIKKIKNRINMEKEKTEKISLKVNGKTIPLSEFPSEFIINTIVGMLGSLKSVDKKIESVEISFKKND
jgi:molybdopterin-guanine dinucleotide biosynthesis protein B